MSENRIIWCVMERTKYNTHISRIGIFQNKRKLTFDQEPRTRYYKEIAGKIIPIVKNEFGQLAGWQG